MIVALQQQIEAERAMRLAAEQRAAAEIARLTPQPILRGTCLAS